MAEKHADHGLPPPAPDAADEVSASQERLTAPSPGAASCAGWAADWRATALGGGLLASPPG
jgi:hypothetical protein